MESSDCFNALKKRNERRAGGKARSADIARAVRTRNRITARVDKWLMFYFLPKVART